MYNGYFGGGHHSHSVAGDFTKLERIDSDHGRDGKMADDMASLALREGLRKRGWHLLSESWPSRHSGECWNRCWFAWCQAKQFVGQEIGDDVPGAAARLAASRQVASWASTSSVRWAKPSCDR